MPPPRTRDDEYEDDDDEDYDAPPRRRGDDSDPTGGLIPLKNGYALAAYYVGVFSLIPCLGTVIGPVAIGLGFAGIVRANRYPRAKGKAHAITGIVLGAVGAVVWFVGAIIAGALRPGR